MNEEDRRYLVTATATIHRVLTALSASPLRPTGLTAELQTFAEQFDRLLDALAVLRRFSIALGNGDLTQEAPPGLHLLDPLKQLHSSLRHLTWQTQRVAAGDLDQQVDFLGEFSKAFNQMIAVLREKHIAEEKVRYLSEHDTLTGLYNRTYFEGELERLRSADLYPVSFVVADLDGLKATNDTLGHQVGDLLIQKAARVIQHGLGTEGILARIGGDEFVIILQGVGEGHAHEAIIRIRTAMEVCNQRDSIFPISISLGAGTAPHKQALTAALRQADNAMYQDKLQRKTGTPSVRVLMGSG